MLFLLLGLPPKLVPSPIVTRFYFLYREMVRLYKTKNLRAQWSEEDAGIAVAAVEGGMSLKKAAKDFHVPRTTLRRKLKLKRCGSSIKTVLGRPTILKPHQELELVNIILNYEARLFGMTLIDIRRLVFQYCEANKIKHSFNQAHKMAGEDWAAGFLRRHQNLSVRKPEAVSIFRAAGFNREKVSRFYDALEAVMFKDNVQIIPATNIYNVDESGYTVCLSSE
jgi:hypothetical protein